MEECCEKCKFWIANEDGEIDGDCHRYPPRQLSFDVPSPDISWDHFGFPVIIGCDWCGEFVMRPPEIKAICSMELIYLLPKDEDGCNRARNCLAPYSKTVGDLLEHTEADLLQTPNLGMRSLKLVIEKLSAHGLRLKEKK